MIEKSKFGNRKSGKPFFNKDKSGNNNNQNDNKGYNKEKKSYNKQDGYKKFPPKKIYQKPYKEEVTYKPDDLIRLNKYLSNSGICSRREADEYIRLGMVSVNGEIITEVGTKVKYSDEVKFNDGVVRPEKKVYMILNKPKDYVTTMDDPNAKRTVMELIQGACKERVYPVGRLDRMTTGVILFTNDGELAKKLTHPANKIPKVYKVELNKPLTHADMQKIVEGFELEDGFACADNISYIEEANRKSIGIEIHSGKNRIVRRIFEHLGYKVYKLDRVLFAGLSKKTIGRGEWRFLSEKEVGYLKMIKGQI